MDDSDEQLHWEDVAQDAINLVEDEDDDELLIALHEENTGSKNASKGASRATISKAVRDHAAMVHKSTVLCIVARTRMLDIAADDPEIQATLLSLVDTPLGQWLQPGMDTQRAINCLLPVLKWFKSTFSILADSGLEQVDVDTLLGPLSRTLHKQVSEALGVRAGPLECITTLFVALLRAHGTPARVARLVDGAPLHPWRKKAPVVRMLKGPGISAKTGDDGTQVAIASEGKGRGRGRGKSGTSDVKAEEAGVKVGTKRKRPGSLPTPAPAVISHNGAPIGGDGVASPSSGPEPGLGPGGARKRNKGDDELEAQLHMAMVATQAEELARQEAAASAAAQQHQQRQEQAQAHAKAQEQQKWLQQHQQAARGAVRQQVKELMGGGRGRGGRRAAGRGGAQGRGSPGGVGRAGPHIVTATPDVPVCWAEVWCGCAESGRWVHVDVWAGVTDRPGSVESAVTAAVGPVSMAGYIVACEHGRVRDVTNRYFSNALSLKKLRDEAWWEQTARALHSLPPVGAHNAQASQVIRTDVGTQPQQRAAAGAAGWTEGGAEGQGGCGGGVLQTSQAPDSAHSHSLSLPDALKTGVTPDDDAGAAERAEEAAAAAAASMRAKREAAELEHKQKTGLSGLPTSIEGFKVHPLYVLKRHITKYEALRPGTTALGLHRGEPFYAREALSELHTTERWLRCGFKVRDEELGRPVKAVKKRKQPPPPKQSGGSFSYLRRLNASLAPAAPAYSRPSPAPPTHAPSSSFGAEAPEEGDEEEGEGGPMVDLYGKWQTDPFIASADNGRVPKNDRGNVEVPPFASNMPLGCVHLNYPGLGPICRALGVDFAPALTGFELQAGRSVPKIEGVVVCEEFGPQVVDAWIERETERVAAAHAKEMREGRAAWLRLLQALRVRMQLAEDYEGVEGEGQKGCGEITALGDEVREPTAHEVAMGAVRDRLLREEGEQGGSQAAQPAVAADTEEI